MEFLRNQFGLLEIAATELQNTVVVRGGRRWFDCIAKWIGGTDDDDDGAQQNNDSTGSAADADDARTTEEVGTLAYQWIRRFLVGK